MCECPCHRDPQVSEPQRSACFPCPSCTDVAEFKRRILQLLPSPEREVASTFNIPEPRRRCPVTYDHSEGLVQCSLDLNHSHVDPEQDLHYADCVRDPENRTGWYWHRGAAKSSDRA